MNWPIKALKENYLKSNITTEIATQETIIDSRKKTKSGLFIALVGDNNDGHDYLEQAFENGAALAIVSKIPDNLKDDNRLILVKDTYQALIDLAKYSRSIFTGKIIAITGSVGKTSIKEMLKIVLSRKNKVFANPGNFNNHIGLPLSLCNLPQNYDFGILEMGMNHLGEIEFLSQIAKPNIAIISNVTSAHIGNFKNEAEIALAKSEILCGLSQDGYAILNKDSKYYDFLKSQALKNNIQESNIINFGKNTQSDVKLESSQNLSDSLSFINITSDKKEVNYNIKSINEIAILNSLIVISVINAIKGNINDYLEGFSHLETPDGRGNIIKINKNNKSLTIINDSYNASLASMIAGLKFLSQLKKQNPKSRTIAIIGDMLELGDNAVTEHKSIAKYIDQFSIDKILLVGELTKNIIPELKKEKIIGHFDNSDNLSEKILNFIDNNDIILIKGSRGIRMEKIINKLQN